MSAYAATLEDLASDDPRRVALAAMGAQPDQAPPLGPVGALPQPIAPAPAAGPPALTELGRTPPSVMPSALPMSRLALTKQQTTPTGPGIVAAPPPAPGYFPSSINRDTGQPNAMSPSLTKLGKLLTVLQAAGKGAIAGSTQPTFGFGFEAAQQNQNEQIGQYQAQQQRAIAAQQARQNLGMVDTPWGAMPMGLYRAILPKVLPAQIAGESRENVADTAAQAKRDVAGTQALSREKVAGIMAQAKKDTAAGVPLTADDIKRYNLPPQFLGTRAKITDIAAAERAGVFKDIPMMTEQGLVVVNRETGKVRQATGDDEQTYTSAALAQPRVAVDPNDPNQLRYETAGQVAREGALAPGSAAHTVAAQAAKAELPKDIGTQKIAFNTAIAHADLLKQVFASVENGDVQLWNRIKNRAKEEFGWSEQPTARLVAEVYAGEINKVINAGHITQAELDKVGGTLPTDIASPGRMQAALGAYQSLAQSKLNQLNLQEQAAIDKAQAKKKKPGANAPPAPPQQGNHPAGFSPF